MDKCTDRAPVFYGIDCSHPSWFIHLFDIDEPWVKRIRHLRGNGSNKSHEELDECDAIDNGDPVEYGEIMRRIRKKPTSRVTVYGGCCGTDERHLEETAKRI